MKLKNVLNIGIATVIALMFTGCAPEVGSDKWCANMKNKSKTDWSVNEATDFAKHCLLN